MLVSELRIAFATEARFELEFWLTVFRDHTFFIQTSLAPDEKVLIHTAKQFHQEALATIEHLDQHNTEGEWRAFAHEMIRYATRLISFKQTLLDNMLACQITIHLPPSLVDHMIREAEEFLGTITRLLQGTPLTGAALAIHESELWLPDGSGHAALIRSNVDPQEEDVFDSAHHWKTEFDKLTLSLQELKTKLRSGVRWVPTLERLMELTTTQFVLFRQYLEHLQEMLAECRILGDLKPLFMDHMAREATYFLQKLERSKHER
jgi:Domain of unknown function (DUF2935)